MKRADNDNPSESAIQAARSIRESLFDLHRLAEEEGQRSVAYRLRLAIIEADHIIGKTARDA